VQRLGHIIGDSGLLVSRKGAAVLGFDSPQAPLVVGLGPAVAANAANQLLVPACSRGLRHRCEWGEQGSAGSASEEEKELPFSPLVALVLPRPKP
jgi:hypothetical protein